MIPITFAITAKDEIQEIKALMPKIIKYYDPKIDDILIQLDTTRSDEVYQYAKQLESTTVNLRVVEFPLNGDFASFKNNLIKESRGKGSYIFFLDADEQPHDFLLEALREIILGNQNVDVFGINRINIVTGLTQSDVDKWRWKIGKNKNLTSSKTIDTTSDEYLLLKNNNLIIEEKDA